jgi:hypothetical protein
MYYWDTQQSSHYWEKILSLFLGGLAAEFPCDWIGDSMTKSTSIVNQMGQAGETFHVDVVDVRKKWQELLAEVTRVAVRELAG